MTVLKSHIAKVVTAEEEEFEFEGESPVLDEVDEDVNPYEGMTPAEEREVRAATDEELEAMFNAPDEQTRADDEAPVDTEGDEKR